MNRNTLHIKEIPENQENARKSTIVSVVVNLFLTLMQVTVGIIAGSQGLIADGIHSLSDLVADFVVLLANHHSSKDADLEHPYGHLRFETAASLILGLLLFIVGMGMLWSSTAKLRVPADIAPVQMVALWVALGALAIKEGLFRYMLAVAKRLRSTMLVANAWHARSDAASSLVVAIGIAGSLMGFPLLDPVTALIVGLMVVKMGWKFTWDALNDLMDHAISEEELVGIRDTLLGTPGVLGIHNLKTRKMGDMVLLDVCLKVNGNQSVRDGHAITEEAKKRVMDGFRVLDVMTHIDPV
ncbi:MAG: cation transporter [Magnetococcales bacterium]|nr:cation transporter [Magnetococcales bacterium]